MSYLEQKGANWGAIVACIAAVPFLLMWSAVSIIGGSLVCADAASHCDGVWWPLVQGVVVIVACAVALGWLINRAIRAISGIR